MPKLPKKSTMKETVNRVKSYSNKLLNAGKLNPKEFVDILKHLDKVLRAIEK